MGLDAVFLFALVVVVVADPPEIPPSNLSPGRLSALPSLNEKASLMKEKHDLFEM